MTIKELMCIGHDVLVTKDTLELCRQIMRNFRPRLRAGQLYIWNRDNGDQVICDNYHDGWGVALVVKKDGGYLLHSCESGHAKSATKDDLMKASSIFLDYMKAYYFYEDHKGDQVY